MVKRCAIIAPMCIPFIRTYFIAGGINYNERFVAVVIVRDSICINEFYGNMFLALNENLERVCPVLGLVEMLSKPFIYRSFVIM